MVTPLLELCHPKLHLTLPPRIQPCRKMPSGITSPAPKSRKKRGCSKITQYPAWWPSRLQRYYTSLFFLRSGPKIFLAQPLFALDFTSGSCTIHVASRPLRVSRFSSPSAPAGVLLLNQFPVFGGAYAYYKFLKKYLTAGGKLKMLYEAVVVQWRLPALE